MDTLNKTNLSPDEANSLFETCFAHLEREAESLITVLKSLEAVRAATVQNDVQALSDALEDQTGAMKILERTRRSRDNLRREIAERLGTAPEASSIHAVATVLPEDLARTLRREADLTASLARQVDDVNRANAFLTRFCQDFVERLLSALVGGRVGCDRYGAAGTVQPATIGCLLEARG